MAFKLTKEEEKKYNDARAFFDDLSARLRDEFDNKSDAWQESDKAGDAEEMIGAWEEAAESIGNLPLSVS